jgi:hypothetical protein
MWSGVVRHRSHGGIREGWMEWEWIKQGREGGRERASSRKIAQLVVLVLVGLFFQSCNTGCKIVVILKKDYFTNTVKYVYKKCLSKACFFQSVRIQG